MATEQAANRLGEAWSLVALGDGCYGVRGVGETAELFGGMDVEVGGQKVSFVRDEAFDQSEQDGCLLVLAQ